MNLKLLQLNLLIWYDYTISSSLGSQLIMMCKWIRTCIMYCKLFIFFKYIIWEWIYIYIYIYICTYTRKWFFILYNLPKSKSDLTCSFCPPFSMQAWTMLGLQISLMYQIWLVCCLIECLVFTIILSLRPTYKLFV